MFERRGRLRVLDVGCGRNATRDWFRSKGHRFLGLDLQNRAADVLGNGEMLPFRDMSFDALHTSGMLQYVLDVAGTLREMYRVLAPGGTLTGNTAFLEPWVWESLVHLSPEGLRRMLEQSGFNVQYIWPGWDVHDAVTAALPEVGIRRARFTGVALRSSLDRLRFAGSINFHAVRPKLRR